MPWQTLTLKQCREMVRDDVTTSLAGAAITGNTVLRVMSDAMAGVGRLILKYLDWLALQLLPDTAEKEWLDRHGQIWLTNSDGSLGRKSATATQGTIGFTGVAGVNIPLGTTLISPTGEVYETLEFKTLPDVSQQPMEAAVRAINPGGSANQLVGTPLSLQVPISGVDNQALTVDLRGGTDQETDEQLRERILLRVRFPPMGGDSDDFVQWALDVPSVTRAWCAPREMGMGTITVRFMCDALRADTGGFPTPEDVKVVLDYLNKMRPVAIKDFYVMAPVPEPISFNLSLVGDSLALRKQVTDSVNAMIYEKAQPAHAVDGQLVGPTTIFASWITGAIDRVTTDYETDVVDHPMPHNGAIAVPGIISWPVP